MQIDNEFQVQAPPREVWEYLQRTEDVVECIPGAAILERINDDAYRGQVTVKLGPMTVVLQGVVTIDERDNDAQMMSLTGRAKDTKGRGATEAGVTVNVATESGGARVTLQSNIKITGKMAQFGRGVMKDVSQRIAEEFARNLEARLNAPEAETQREVEPVALHEQGQADGVAPAGPVAGVPRRSPTPSGQATSSVGGLRLVGGALIRTLTAAVGRLMRRISQTFRGGRRGSHG